jgi:hypothetical protein
MAIYQANPPSQLNTVGQALVDSGNYNPDPSGQTKCNLYLSDFAHQVYLYDGLSGKVANDIVDFLRTGVDDWKPIYDVTVASNPSMGQAFNTAQDDGNSGFFVVIGLKVSGGSGHVAAVVTGTLQSSASWAGAGLPANVPVIAQAGKDVFCGKGLNYGLTPQDVNNGDFVVYVRQSSQNSSQVQAVKKQRRP